MGGKKKPEGGKGKGGAEEEEDLTTKELLSLYRKNCSIMEIPTFHPLVKKIDEVLTEGEIKFPEILINEKIGEAGARAIANALRTSK